MHKIKMIFIVCSLLVLCSGTSRLPALAQAIERQGPITNQDIVINGDFAQDQTAWSITGLGSGINATAGQDSGPALVLDNITGDPADNRAIALQELHLPSQTTAASYAFDYRLVQTYGTAGWLEAGFMRGTDIQSATVITVVVSTNWVYSTIDWQQISGSLSATDVISMQAAHAAGEHVWFVVNLHQPAANAFQAHLDNVTFNVTGSMDYPTTTGTIAYIGADSNNFDKTVNTIKADGTGKQTVWTHPSTIPDTNHIYDLSWKPDASEIAFSSNHETAYSAFHSDVYGIKPDGQGLRRITNPPSKAEIDAGGYTMGTVTGSILNNYGNVTTFFVYVEGAQDIVSVDVGDYGATTGFSVPNVADLGSTSHYVVFIWSTGSCANGREYAAAIVDVVPGGTADAGQLSFNGTCGTYDSTAITWKRDGTELGVDVITPRKFSASGEAIGTDLFNAPLTADAPAWSPTDDQILYRNWIISGDTGIYLTTAGGGTGTWLVNSGNALWITPAWLPDGSGFVYTIDNQLRQFILSGSQDTLLAEFFNEYVDNPSVSPGGNYVVFERRATGTAPVQYNLWILNRSKPAEMWAVTNDGKSYNPDWSSADAQTMYTLTTYVVGNGTVTPDAGSYSADTQLSLSATPDAGWQFDAWSGDATSTANPLDLTMDSHKTLTATFSKVSEVVSYTLNVNIVGSGAVTPNAGTYISGTALNLTATPATNWQFDGWSGDVNSTTNPFNLILDSNKTVTATFTPMSTVPTYTLTTIISPTMAGTVTLNPSGGVYPENTVVTLTAENKLGYTFAQWSGALSGSTNPVAFTMTQDAIVTANFEAAETFAIYLPLIVRNQ